MIEAEPLSLLRQHQTLLLEIIRNMPAGDYARQFHPELSPFGWHLGHCVYIESYWVREVLLGREEFSAEPRWLYTPQLSAKAARSFALPPYTELCSWAADMQTQNLAYLTELLANGEGSGLLRENYLFFFLSQHYAQHVETAQYILAQRALQLDTNFVVDSPLSMAPLQSDYRELPRGSYAIGAGDCLRHYDNECPGFYTDLAACQIAHKPVSNAEYLGFMQAGGYENADYWSAEGWQWRTENAVTQPQHWRQDETGNYYATDNNGPCALAPGSPVSGLCLHEARALANWAGARLPHEYEWEAAKKAGLLAHSALVWEWCDNPFHPYAGFAAFPYDEYSLPWFDQRHFTLRGGSHYTLPLIKRDTFRNFYEADKRHFPAGVRLVSR